MDMEQRLLTYMKLTARPGSLISGQIELTSLCDQACPGCWKKREFNRPQVLPLEIVQGVLTYLGMRGLETVTLSGGEPLAWPHLTDLLQWFQRCRGVGVALPKVFISTAFVHPLPQDIRDLLCSQVSRIRVSLDALSPEVYTAMRGDKQHTPERVLGDLAILNHPGLGTLTVICPTNLGEMLPLARRLSGFSQFHPLRKVWFLKQMDQGVNSPEFERAWTETVNQIRQIPGLPTNLNGLDTFYQEIHFDAFKSLPCRVGRFSFHLKANGDWYPCCLAGGEALKTRSALRVGNILEEDLKTVILRAHQPVWRVYDALGCQEICLKKQFTYNRLAEEAKNVSVNMP